MSSELSQANRPLRAKAPVGPNVLIPVALIGDDAVRLVHGVVRRFAHVARDEALSHYRAEVVPELWFASLSGETRTFEGKTPIEILDAVCRRAEVPTGPHRVSAAPAARGRTCCSCA